MEVSISSMDATVSKQSRPASMDHRAVFYTLNLVVDGVLHVFRCGHGSGKYNAPIKDVVSYYNAVIKKNRIAVFTTTESQEKGIAKALRSKLGSGYAVRRVGAYICVVDKKVLKFTLTPQKLVRMTRTKGFPDWRNLFVGVFRVRLLADTRVPIAVTVGHTPAGVEYGKSWRMSNPKAVETHKKGLVAWGRWIDKLKKTTVALAHGDYNTDFKTEFWRRNATERMRGQLIWNHANTKNSIGSHTSRIIDGAIIRKGRK